MKLKALGAAALLSFLPYQALAGPVTLNIDSVTGVWTSASGAAVGGLGTNQISWGTPLGASQSSYVFDGVAPPTQGPFSAGDDFTLGTFTHNNFPITGSAITGATLEVTIMGTAQNGSSENFNLTSTFDFDHFETPNGANPCA
ncbi:MAG: choice-of-anchor K domain-containing protein, partial [Pseudomonadota bacterium]